MAIIRNILKNLGIRTLVPAIENTYELPIEGTRLSMDRGLTKVLDLSRGSRYNLTGADVKTRALATHPDIGNTKPLSVLYLNAITVKNPCLPAAILANPPAGLEAHIELFSETRAADGKDILWIMPEGGIEHHVHSGYKYIPGFPEYAINSNAEIIRVADGVQQTSIQSDGLTYVLNSVDNTSVTIDTKYLMVLAFGKYDTKFSDEVYFLDGDETNLTEGNILVSMTDSEDLSAELADGDENNIANF